MKVPSRDTLFLDGAALVQSWCRVNKVEAPEMRVIPRAEWQFDACAYYRPTYIAICIEKCAVPGLGGRSWSWPGYVVDRTPFGVLAHELGHHVDRVVKGAERDSHQRDPDSGPYYSGFSKELRRRSCEEQLTSYCPDNAEWFAEMFRLFVTNPDLLKNVRPRTYDEMLGAGLKPLPLGTWGTVLAHAPERYHGAAANKIKAAVKEFAAKQGLF